MAYRFNNNAFSFLTSDIGPTVQDITIRSADAGLFPQPDQAKGELFMVTLEDRATNKMEICECFRRVGATLSLRRAREGTTPETFTAGATVSNRLTARTIEAGLQGWIEFNRRYLGAYAAAPTLDPMGFPLQPGAIFYDLNTDSLFVFTRDGWVKWSPSGDLQTGIPPGGQPGDVLTRNSEGLATWQAVVDKQARDSAQLGRDAAAAAAAAAQQAQDNANSRLSLAGGIVTGNTYFRFPADTSGNRTSNVFIDSDGTGVGQLHFTRAGKRWRTLGGGAGELQVGLHDATGAFQAWKKLLLAGDALPSSGGTVGGSVTVTDTLTVMGAAVLKGVAALPPASTVAAQDAAAGRGGQIFFARPRSNLYGAGLDLYNNTFRLFRDGDGTVMSSMDLQTGILDVPGQIYSGYLRSRGDIRAESAMWARVFRFWPDSAGDTGYDWSGEGYSTIISNGAPVAQFQPGGHLYVWGNVTGFSDKRLKEGIRPFPPEDALDIVRQLNGVRFIKKGEPGRDYIGFIAQEVEPLLPEVIDRSKDGMLGINYGVMVALVSQAVKALDDRMALLEEMAHGKTA